MAARTLANSSLVLILDDRAESSSAAALALTIEGHSTRQVTNHTDALDFGKNCRVDLLIAHIGIPGRFCEKILGEIRALYPIGSIAVTGWGDGEIYSRRGWSGFDRWLFKPLSSRDLLAAVAEVLLRQHKEAMPVFPDGACQGIWV